MTTLRDAGALRALVTGATGGIGRATSFALLDVARRRGLQLRIAVGASRPGAPLATLDVADWDAVFAIDVRATSSRSAASARRRTSRAQSCTWQAPDAAYVTGIDLRLDGGLGDRALASIPGKPRSPDT